MNEESTTRRPMLSIIGNAGEIPEAQRQAAFAIGRCAVERGFRIVCGGMDGVMQAAAQGAHAAKGYREGDTVGIAMSYDASEMNPWIDVRLATGVGFSRNMMVVASGDVVVAIGGGSGTLSEIALAWQIERPILVYEDADGWAKRLAGMRLDGRAGEPLEAFHSPASLVERAWVLAKRSRQGSGRLS